MKDAAVEEISIPSMPLDILPDSTTAYVLNGRVENSAGDPLIGATISVVNSSNNAITDFNGDFKISLQDTQRGQLQIDYVGYKPQTILANNQKNVKVILQEAQALDEVTVAKEEARMSRKKSSSAKKDFINSAPKPITGFKNYKQYIQKELTYPRLARENNIQGTVRLEFFVDGSGTPTNFRVLKTLGFGCDAEAMLLLENGPKWSHPGKVVYEVEFKL
jgi:TonB family protein